MAFSRPSLPWMAKPWMGQPIAPAKGRAASGDSIATPMKVTAAPRPTSDAPFDGLPNSPYRRAAAPSAVTMSPMTRRRPRPLPTPASCESRSAWTGATRAARRAGRMQEATVTTVPTISDTTMVLPRSCKDVLGRSMPNALSNPCRATARPIPATTPRMEATSPVTKASETTETITWRRLAPMARKSASSFVRCATMMENVLKMMKAPTNSAMNANASNAVRKNPSPSWSAFDCSSDTVALVTASTPFGRADVTCTRNAEGSTPSFATTSISSNTPGLPRKSCAVFRSNRASVAPPRLSAVPKPVMPEIVKVRTPSGPTMSMDSPSVRWYLDAVPASTTT